MATPVVAAALILPVYETSMRKCERCPTRYLEVKRIGEEGHRLCCACWWELAEDTVIYGRDVLSRQALITPSAHVADPPKNKFHEGDGSAEVGENAAYWRQVQEQKRLKVI